MSSALTRFRTEMPGFPRLTHVPSGGKAKLRMLRSASYNMLIPEWREATQRRWHKPCSLDQCVLAQRRQRVQAVWKRVHLLS